VPSKSLSKHSDHIEPELVGSRPHREVLCCLANSHLRGDAAQHCVAQGVKSDFIEALGLGPNLPVADNSTAEGRQRNRRVEIIISGEVIGSQVGGGRR
jgi:TolB-like protein